MDPDRLWEQFCQELGQVIESMLERGMKMPMHVAVVSKNGQMLLVRCTWGAEQNLIDFSIVATHGPEEVFFFPVNLLVVDREGTGGRVLIDETRELRLF